MTTSNVYWITGLSGAGKSTLAERLVERLRHQGKKVISLDGDVMRDLFNNQFAHTREERLAAAYQYGRLCQFLVAQNVHVVCATISMFHEIQAWNRKNIPNYIEIFVDVPITELIARDNKKIYSRGLAGELSNVVGIDITPEFPQKPDITIQNFGNTSAEKAIEQIMIFQGG